MVRDHAGAIRAVRGARAPLSRASTLLADAWRRGGRWILVGAGTSGRLAVLEAAELPPTFGTPARRVVATMAGGPTAVRRAREGVEDDTRAGALAMRRLQLTRDDVVIGISASGVTPFVIAAMRAARAAGARTVAIACVPAPAIGRGADVVVRLRTGPEVIAGSTRLKAGTATKVALNILTTSAMVALGRTRGNLMASLQTNSAKLRDRAARIARLVEGVVPVFHRKRRKGV